MKNFQLNILIKIILIIANIFLVQYLIFKTELTATVILLAIILLVQIYNLIKFINLTNREITRFLLSVRHSDFSQNFSLKKYGKSFEYLGNAMDNVLKDFRDTRSENEENLKYLETVLRHIDIGLISYDKSGKVNFINNAAKKLLNISHLVNINSLIEDSKKQWEILRDIKPGRKNVVKLFSNDEISQIAISASKFKQRDIEFTLISFQNIQNELEEQELLAWNKLIRVLTHEIMNSITPISSLAGTVKTILSSSDSDVINNQETLDDISEAVTTIEKRSSGLINFVDNYRSLTRIPEPDFKIIKVEEIFNSLKNLFSEKFEKENISFLTSVKPGNLDITTDHQMLEQVLINIIKNATEALSRQTSKKIELNAYLNIRGNFVLEICDNGPGIKEDILEKLFIPFFTTKPNGSGIGLSLSKQIIRSLGGNIKVSSGENTGTIFSIIFYR